MMSENTQDLHTIELEGKTITLVGTAHVSAESVALVDKTIRERMPDVVAIELDERRLEVLKDPERWKKTDIYKSIKDGNSYILLTQLLLQSFQKKISSEIGVKPGAEMMAAYSVAKALELKSICIDRDIRTTLKRAWARASWWSITKVFFALIASIFDTKKVSSEEIEKLKEKDVLSAALEEFSELLPDVKTSLIDERDSYMAQKLLDAPGKNILAIVGAGHVPGMLRELYKSNSIEELDKIPEKTGLSKFSGWIFPSIIISLVVVGFFVGGKDTSTQMVLSWVLFTGGFAALGAIISLAHPISILVAFIMAPLTTLHPLLAAGWFSGMSEAYFRKPRIEDLESVSDDLNSFSGWWKNRVSRVLLVVMFSNLGAALGSVVGATSIVRSIL
jgi:pheromone shutdown-related protein TraB